MIATQVASGPTPTRIPSLVSIVAQDIVKQYLLNCLAQFDPEETADLEWWWDVATGGHEQVQWSASYETTTKEGQERWTVIGAGITVANGGELVSVPGRWTVIYGWRHPLARDGPASEALHQFTKRTPRERCL